MFRFPALPSLPPPAKLLWLALAYFVLARASLLLAFAGSNASPVWPPAGLALAALTLGGLRFWPAIALGAFAANVSAFLAGGQNGPSLYLVSAGIALGNSGAAAAGAWLLRRFADHESPLGTMANGLRLLGVAPLAALISASAGLAALTLGHIVPPGAAATVGLTWWMGDLTGMLIVAPLIFAWLRPAGDLAAPGRLYELPVVLTGVGLLAWLLFAVPLGSPEYARLWLFLLIPALAAIALRWGLRGAASANLVIASLAVVSTHHGIGLFSQGPLNEALIQCDLLLGLFSVIAILVAADLSERRRLVGTGSLWQQTGWSWIGLLASFSVTVLAWHLIARAEEERLGEAFRAQTETVQRQLGNRIADYQLALRGASALFQVKDTVTRSDWHEYFTAIALQRLMPGAQGIGFARQLAPGEVAAHVGKVRAEGFPEYSMRPPGERDQHVVITYIEPLDRRNRRAFGFDMASEATRRLAMDQARDSGQPTASGKVTLVQEDTQDPQPGFLIFLPVYRADRPLATVAQRRAAILGHVYIPFRMRDLVESSLGDELRHVSLQIFDGEVRHAGQRLYPGPESDPLAANAQRQMRSSLPLDVGQHVWTLALTTKPEFFAARSQYLAALALFSGLLLSLGVFALVRTLALTRRQALQIAQQMREAYSDAESRLNALVNSTREAILVADRDGRILSANPSAQALFGHESETMTGATVEQLMCETSRPALQATMESLRRAPAHETRQLTLRGRTRGGAEFPLDLSLSHWLAAGGELFGLIVRDVSDLQRADEFMRGVFDEGSDAMLVTAPDGRILRANRAAERLFGHPVASMTELSVEDLIPHRLRAAHAGQRTEFSAGDERRSMGGGRIVLAQHADGHEFPVDVTLNTLLLPTGKQIIATVMDISERRRAEQRIHELVSLQSAILTSANFSIITTTPDGLIVSFNRAAEKMLGYRTDEVVGKTSPAILHDADEVARRARELSAELGQPVEPGFEVFVAKARLGQVEEREWTYIRRDGSRLPVRLSVTALRDEAGGISGFMGIASDITSLKKAEQTLRESESMLRGLFELSPLGIALTDLRGGYVEFNEAFRAICGYPSDELYALDYWKLTPPEYADQEASQLEMLVRTGRYGPYEKEYVQKSGKRVPIRLNGVKMTLQGQDYIWSIVEDISPQRAAAEAIVAAKQAAESASRAKGDFLANMSHEIRTPLNAILGLTQLVLESDLNETQNDYLRKVHDSSQALLHILNDILDYSKIEAGRLDLERREFSMTGLIESCQGLFSAQAASKGLSLTREIASDVPHCVVGDSLRLAQVLHNLVGNALKFTDKGGVKLSVRVVAIASAETRLEFSVRDTGIGIAPDQIPQLFQAFTQADTSVTRKHGGTGLGLAISRRLVELMDGHISAESTPGQGSCFRFDARFELGGGIGERSPDLPAADYREQARALRGARLLVVEDNELSRTVARELLLRAGFRVSVAVDGFDALERAGSEQFDAILMDWQLPGIDGLETTRRLRQIPGYRQTPIIAVTAAAMQQDRDACLAAGMNDHLAKPIQPDQLIAVLARWIPARTDGDSAPTAASSPSQLAATLARELPEFEVTEAIRRTGDNAMLYARLLSDFHIAKLPLVAELRAGEATSEDLHRLAHSLRGESANLGLRQLAGAADAMLQAARHGDSHALPELRQRLADCLEACLRRLAACVGLQAQQPAGEFDLADLHAKVTELADHLAHNRLKGKRLAEEIAASLEASDLAGVFRPTLEAAREMNFKDALHTLPGFIAALENHQR